MAVTFTQRATSKSNEFIVNAQSRKCKQHIPLGTVVAETGLIPPFLAECFQKHFAWTTRQRLR